MAILHRPRRARMVVALTLIVAAAQLAAVPANARPDAPLYVALGDSFAAGPLIPLQEEPWGCLKSTNNYPKLLASAAGITNIRDVTCSGADTGDMTKPQGVWPEPNPAQFDALDDDVDLVTLQIGGNDIGFGGIAQACAEAAFAGESCKEQFVQGDHDELRARIADAERDVAEVIEGIADRAPDAEILVLGYPGIFRFGPVASCPVMGVSEDDAQYLRGVHEELNAMIERVAKAAATEHEVTYVDVYAPSEGHTACDLPVIRWVEPIVPLHAAAPVHPNLTGMQAVGEILLDALPYGLAKKL